MSFIHSQHQSFSAERSNNMHSFSTTSEKKSPLKGVILAVISIICSSSIPPFVNLYKGVPIPVIGAWRHQLSCIYCIPISWYMMKKLPKIDKRVFTWATLAEIVIAATFFCIASVMFLMSSRKTLYSHTMTLANSGGIILILVNVIRLLPISKYEIVGTIVVIGGIFALINDSESTKGDGSTNILLGDTFALISMPCYTLAYVFNARAIQKLPSLVVFHCFSVVQLILFTSYIFMFSGIEAQVLFSRDPFGGLLGWSDSNWILLSTLIIAPICGVLGVGCYVFLLDFFPPHIVNGIFLLEPFTGQLIGCILGQDGWPTTFTYVGAIFVTLGLGLTILGNAKTEKEQGDTKDDFEVELSEDSLL